MGIYEEALAGITSVDLHYDDGYGTTIDQGKWSGSLTISPPTSANQSVANLKGIKNV